MDSSAGTRRLGSLECRSRLESHRLGRLVFNDDQGHPMALPVNYAMQGANILMRSGTGTKLAAAARGERAAFLIDELQPVGSPAWSVLAKGTLRLLSEDEFEAASAIRLELAAGTFHRDHFMLLEVDEVTGRELQGFGGA